MNTKNVIAGIIGGVVHFLLSFLIYGILLMSYMEENMASGFSRPQEEMNFPILIVSNLIFGFFIVYIFSGWDSARSLIGGLKTGLMIGLLMSAAIGLELFGVSTIYLDMTTVFVDMAAITAMTGVTGAAVGWWMGRDAGN